VYENQNIEELGVALEKRRVLFVKVNDAVEALGNAKREADVLLRRKITLGSQANVCVLSNIKGFKA
jgi:hypothetical protein